MCLCFHLYSASSSLLYYSEAHPTQHGYMCRNFTPKRHRQLRVKDLSKVSTCMVARAGIEPTTLRKKGHKYAKAPPRPIGVYVRVYCPYPNMNAFPAWTASSLCFEDQPDARHLPP